VNIPTQAKTGLEWATVSFGVEWAAIWLWLAEQEVNVLGHHNISINVEPVTTPHAFDGEKLTVG